MSPVGSLKQYFQEARIELKKVIWPTKKETVNSTILVVGFCIAFAIFLGALDFVFNLGLEKLIQ